MQHLRHLPSPSWKSGRSSNRSVGGHLAFGNASNGGLDANSHLRRLMWRTLTGRRFIRTSLPRTLPQVFASLLHSAIHPTRISHSDPTETSNHNMIPCNNGRCPTRLIVATEMPLPIKNRVAVNPTFAQFTAIA